jgi:UDP:flavonoid glycosyltransferase YjiC (YdhE family)
MPRSAKVVLVTWDGAGNQPPQRALLRALMARGHTAEVLAHASLKESFERDGASFTTVGGARHYDSREPMPTQDEMPFVVQYIWYERAFGRELLAAMDRLRPDLLLIDICLTHALVAARKSGVATVVLGHFPYALLVGPFAPLAQSRLGEVNAYASELGLEPFASHMALVESASLVLVPTYRQFDAVATTAPHVVHVGPCRSPQPGTETWRRRHPGPRPPLVVVGLSTSHQNQIPLLQRLCDALAGLDVEALVTTGPAIAPESIKAGNNTMVRRFVAHDDVLPAANLLVTHAGHGTVMAGLSHGVPLLCLPMGRDQPMIAARVAELGVGSVISPDAQTTELRKAVAAALGDGAAVRKAKAFAQAVSGHAGLERAVQLTEKLLPTES